MRTRVSVSYGKRRTHLAVLWCGGEGTAFDAPPRGWCLQWAHPTPHGYRYDDPIAAGFTTKKRAEEWKRWHLVRKSREAKP